MNILMEAFLWITYLSALYFAIFWLLTFIEKRDDFRKEEKRELTISDYPYVSIIIPAYNSESTIQECLSSVANLDYPKDKLEIIAVNDGSKDSTGQMIREFAKANKKRNIRLISRENKGKAASLNEALGMAKGELFACLDSDSFVERETLKKMVYAFKTGGDDLKIVIPALKISKPKNMLQKLQHMEYLISMFLNRILSHLDSNYVAPGPFSLYSKAAVVDSGGFDENNLTEDQEIAYRMQSNHYDIVHCHDAYVHTVAPDSISGLSKQRNRWYKGGLINLINYRRIILNKEYGHFGMFQLPMIFFLSIGAIATVVFFNYYVTWPVLKNLYNLYLVGFDIMPYIKSFRPTFDLLSLDLAKGMAAFFVLFFTAAIVAISVKNAKEKLSIKTLMYAVPYFMIYYIIISFIAVISLAELLVGKTQKW